MREKQTSVFLEKMSINHRHHYHRQRRSSHHHRRRRCLSTLSAMGLCTLILLAGIKESLSTYSTTMSSSTTTTVSPANLLPYFDFDVPRNLTVTVGQTGFLHCRVERLGDKDVSWIRQRDLHILTAGSTTYTSDQRFQVIRPENSGNWTLQIKYPQPRDSGIYECQINTEPKMSLSYTFNVIELKANILGPSDLYVKSGSDINLTCRILQQPHELGNIFWYKGTDIIDMTTNQNELDSGTRISVENDWTDGLTSRLKIRRAMPSDTGNYTCVPTIARTSSVYVHVIIGEHPAAMQGNSSSINGSNFYASIYCLLFTILTCCLQHILLPTRAATFFSTSTANVTTADNKQQKRTLRTQIAMEKSAILSSSLPTSTETATTTIPIPIPIPTSTPTPSSAPLLSFSHSEVAVGAETVVGISPLLSTISVTAANVTTEPSAAVARTTKHATVERNRIAVATR